MLNQTLSVTLFLSAMGAVSGLADPPVAEADPSISKNAESPEKLYQTARDLLKGGGGEADARKGFELMRQAADQDYLPAVAGVAYLYNVGMGTGKSLAEATRWLRKAAEKGHEISQFNLGKLLIAEETPLRAGAADLSAQHHEGLQWLRKAAAQGQNDAKTAYGILLMNGDLGLKPDPALAATGYLIPAAEAGNTDAMNALGTLYKIGNGVAHDPVAAEQYFRRAAMAGNVKAQANLGEHLDPSSKKESSRVEAFAWLFIAEEAKNAVAMKILRNKLPATSPDDISAARTKAAEIRRQLGELKK